MNHDPIRLQHAKMDWEHEKAMQEAILGSKDLSDEEKEIAVEQLNRANHYLSIINYELEGGNPVEKKPPFCDAAIYVEGRWYYLYKNGPLKDYPYMVDAETGEIPYMNQRPLLRHFLIDNGADIEPWEKRTTHWCIREAIKIATENNN